MREFPPPIHHAVAALTRLPGVGPKTALRYVFSLLRLSPRDLQSVGQALQNLVNIQTCTTCFTYAEEKTCSICADPKRKEDIICIVAHSRDIATIEATSAFLGRYFVLGGTLNPIEGRTPEYLNTHELMTHLAKRPNIKESILAFSPDVHGETTIMYLTRQLKAKDIKTTRLARGLPVGADIEYTDEVTLSDALTGRRET